MKLINYFARIQLLDNVHSQIYNNYYSKPCPQVKELLKAEVMEDIAQESYEQSLHQTA